MIIGILAPGGSGGTFLDWTLHWMAGDSDYTYIPGASSQQSLTSCVFTTLTSDPLKGTTAHNHRKTHPNDTTVHQCINHLMQTDYPGIKTFYYVDSMVPERQQPNHRELILKYPNVLFIELSFDPEMVHMIFCNQMEKIPDTRDRFIQTAALKTTTPTSLNHIREILSLYYPSCVGNQLSSVKTPIAANHYVLNYRHLLIDMYNVLPEIFDWLQIQIIARRFQAWQPIYKKWIDTPANNFFSDLNEIVEDIIHGHSKCLDPYNMTLAKEIVIANHLMFGYNKALKSDGFEKMPINTQQWFDLLEENIYHDLSIYQKRKPPMGGFQKNTTLPNLKCDA